MDSHSTYAFHSTELIKHWTDQTVLASHGFRGLAECCVLGAEFHFSLMGLEESTGLAVLNHTTQCWLGWFSDTCMRLLHQLLFLENLMDQCSNSLFYCIYLFICVFVYFITHLPIGPRLSSGKRRNVGHPRKSWLNPTGRNGKVFVSLFNKHTWQLMQNAFMWTI